jgi:hypothetical protein
MSPAASWWDDDPELARLRFDSALRGVAGPAGAWAECPGRVLTFVASRLTVELEVQAGGLRGRLVPQRSGVVVVCREDGECRSAAADDAGQFMIGEAPQGPVRLRVDTTDGLIVITEPIIL